MCLPGVSASTTGDKGWAGRDLLPFYCAELSYLPRLSGQIKVISWASLALKTWLSFVFGWKGVRGFVHEVE